jgi:hypothetical protein
VSDNQAVHDFVDGHIAPTDRIPPNFQLKQLEPDHFDLAGLPLQLDRPGGCEVLISSLPCEKLKSPGVVRGFLIPGCG